MSDRADEIARDLIRGTYGPAEMQPVIAAAFRSYAAEGARAWAVAKNGAISIRTIMDTRRAAIVNWLCVEHAWVALRDASDEDIESMWRAFKGDAEAVEVSVVLRLSSPTPAGGGE